MANLPGFPGTEFYRGEDHTRIWFGDFDDPNTELRATPDRIIGNAPKGFIFKTNETGESRPEIQGSVLAFFPNTSFVAGTYSTPYFPRDKSFCFGDDTVAAYRAVALGFNAKALKSTSYALGFNAQASGNSSYAIGKDSFANGDFSYAIGGGAISNRVSYSIGSDSVSNSNYSYAMGRRATTTGDGSYAIGQNASTSAGQSYAIGNSAKTEGNFSYAIGDTTTAKKLNSYAFGRLTVSDQNYTSIFGNVGTSIATASPGVSGPNSYGGVGNPSVQLTNQSVKVYISASNVAGYIRCFGASSRIGASNFTTENADYAELFEWENDPGSENQYGYFVSTRNEKIVLADNDDDVDGITSESSGLVGDYDGEDWQGRYLKNIFNKVIFKDSYFASVKNYLLEKQYDLDVKVSSAVVDLSLADSIDYFKNLIPLTDEELIELSNLEPVETAIESDLYDPSIVYVPRKERGWVEVGMLGKIYVRDNGLCIPGQKCSCLNGIAIPGNKWKILSRLSENIIRIIYK